MGAPTTYVARVPTATTPTSDVIEKYRLAFQVSPTPLLLVADDGRIVMSNPPLEELFGYDAGGLDGRRVEILLPDSVRSYHPELRDAYFTLPTRRSMGTGRDLFGKSRTGELIPIEIGLDPVLAGERKFVLVSILDISERKQNETKIRLAIDAAATAMVMADRHGKIVLTNRPACDLFGYPDEELIGQPIERLIPERFRRRHPVYRQSYSTCPEPRAMGGGRALFGVRRDGTEFPVEIGLTPIESHDELFFMSTIQDITERRKADERLRRQNAELSRLNEELTHFAYSISHDLKAPLASIDGLLRFAAEDLESGDSLDARQSLAQASRLAGRLATRIEQVLSIVRADFHDESLEPLCVEKVVREIWADVAPAERAEALSYRSDTDDTIHTVPRRFRTIVENLVSNAYKYAHADRELRIEIRAARENGSFTIRVADNGIGIPDAEHENVFKMFTRVADHDEPGSGLGLALVKKNVDKLGGTIALTSSGAGSRFTVTLPRTAEE